MSTLFFPSFLLLTACVEPKGTVTEEVAFTCETEFFFDDGTGDGNGELCFFTDTERYANLVLGVFHYRTMWEMYADVDVEQVCENVLCNLVPSSLCMSNAQFWETGDGWNYAVCRTEDDGDAMAFWRRYGYGSVPYVPMEELSLDKGICE